MKKYLLEHIDELEIFCKQNNITVESILNSPKSFNKDIMYILDHDEKLGRNGLKDETPAKVLLIIRKKGNHLEFSPQIENL